MTGHVRSRCRAVVMAAAFACALPAQSSPSTAAPRLAVVLHGSADEGSIGFGMPFELDVVRRWPASAPAPAWSSAVLAPLVVTELGATTTQRGDEVVETRRCRARVFQRGAVTLLPRSDAARTLLVDSALPAEDQGVLELPPLPPLEIRPVRRVLARALAVALGTFGAAWLLVVVLRAVRRRRERVPLRTRLLRDLEALAERAPGSPAEARAEAIAATGVLRAAERRLRDTKIAPEAGAVALADRLLDEVKFAGRELAGAERAQVLGTLRTLVAALPEDAA